MNRLSDIARLVRRICLLREQGEAAAAAQLEGNELATAVRDLRLAHGLEAVTEAQLQEMFATEERRVADAVVLAELLIPQLASGVASKMAIGPQAKGRPVPNREESVAETRRAESGAGGAAIPDLLDAMLAADRAARRQKNNRLGS